MKTNISKLSKVAFEQSLLQGNTFVGDDAAMIDRGDRLELVTQTTMLEGIDFDLSYFPLKHLGYKAVVAALSNIYAMNGTPQYITVSLGISVRFAVEDIQELYVGINSACENYGIELIGGNTSASLTGLMIAVSAIGEVAKERVTPRTGASEGDLVCISGGLGAAYLGLSILEREKRALQGNAGAQAKLDGYQYHLGKQLFPQAPSGVIEALEAAEIVPTAMIDITRGLASAALHICHASQVGIRIMLDRIPIAKDSFAVAEEFGIDPVVAALNGGDDFELLFTVPASQHKDVLAMGEVIGYIAPQSEGANLITPDNNVISITSPDFTAIDPDSDSELEQDA